MSKVLGACTRVLNSCLFRCQELLSKLDKVLCQKFKELSRCWEVLLCSQQFILLWFVVPRQIVSVKSTRSTASNHLSEGQQ